MGIQEQLRPSVLTAASLGHWSPRLDDSADQSGGRSQARRSATTGRGRMGS